MSKRKWLVEMTLTDGGPPFVEVVEAPTWILARGMALGIPVRCDDPACDRCTPDDEGLYSPSVRCTEVTPLNRAP